MPKPERSVDLETGACKDTTCKEALNPEPETIGSHEHEGFKCLDLGNDGQAKAEVGTTDGVRIDPPKPTLAPGFTGDLDDEPDREESVMWLANYQRSGFDPRSLFPPLKWVPAYLRVVMGKGTAQDEAGYGGLPYSFGGDLSAGLTVGVMLVPQSLAFALLAGLPVQAGLYSSFVPLIAYGLLGTIRQVQPGPTALMSLLTGQALDQMGVKDPLQRIQAAALLALVKGVMLVILGAVRFGFIVDFMSHSVMTAFCTAAGITIGTSQLKHMFGISMPRKKYWWQTASYLVMHLDESDLPTCSIGFTLLGLLMLLKYWKSAGSADDRRRHLLWRWFPKDKKSKAFRALKTVADLSSLISVVIGWVWAYAYKQGGVDSVRLVGDVDADGFEFGIPGTGLNEAVQFDTLAISAIVMAMVGFLETMAVGGKFAMQGRYPYDSNQELIALGVSNVMGSFMHSYPTTGSFSRTAVNALFGATSTVATIISSVVVLAAMLFMLPVVAGLPFASLAPIIIQGAIGVINFKDFRLACGASLAEFVVMVATLVVSLAMTVKEGLLVGFVFSILKTMNDLANPNLVVCGRLRDGSFRDVRNFPHAELLPKAVIIRMDARLSFANSRKMKEFLTHAVQVRETQGDKIEFVVIDCKAINHVDLTGCEMLESLAESLQQHTQSLILANLKGPVSRCLDAAHVPQVVRKHGGHLCIDMDQAIAIMNGASPDAASVTMQEYVRRVKSAALIMHATANSYACGRHSCTQSPDIDAKRVTKSLPVRRNLPKAEDSTAPSTPDSVAASP